MLEPNADPKVAGVDVVGFDNVVDDDDVVVIVDFAGSGVELALNLFMFPKDVVAPNTGLGLLGTVFVSLNEFNGVIFPGEKLNELDPKVACLLGSGGGSLFNILLSGC